MIERSIHIRKRLLGPFNKLNARCYTVLLDLVNRKMKEKTEKVWKEGISVFGKIDIQSDPLINIYAMLLQTTYYSSTDQYEKACIVFDRDLTFYHQHPNKLILYEVAREMRVAGNFLFQYKDYKEKGFYWMEKSLEYLRELENNVRNGYA